MERRTVELRASEDAGTLSGVLVSYGERAVVEGRPERFEAGAFGEPPAVPLTVQHNPDWIAAPASAVALIDGPARLELRAHLSPDSPAVRLVRSGAMRGLSVEFRALDEEDANGVRVVKRAELAGASLVDVPAYRGSRVEARQGPQGAGLAVPPVWML